MADSRTTFDKMRAGFRAAVGFRGSEDIQRTFNARRQPVWLPAVIALGAAVLAVLLHQIAGLPLDAVLLAVAVLAILETLRAARSQHGKP